MSLKSLRSIFYEDDPVAGTPTAPVATAPVISNTPSVPVPDAAETAALDQKLHGLLMTALTTADIGAYRALDDMLDSLTDVVPDETIRYKKALEILAKQGHTLPLILEDIDKAIGALEESSRDFEATQKSQFQKSVGTLHQTVDDLTASIVAKQGQAAKLNQEVVEMTQRRSQASGSISTAQAEIDHVGGRYTAVYQTIMKEVQTQRAAVEQRLKATP